ncbi:MAG TPA: hypothetical protein VFZ21_32595 [Gemmatimonadaceae bacterium]|jgi:hypothetical protein|nr:hypothetical protein [Gemmatimonadaceae bacterium]
MRKTLPAGAGPEALAGRCLLVAFAAVTVACAGEPPPPIDTTLVSAAVCDTAGARAVVEQFGDHLRDVSLLAPDSVVRDRIREAYAPYVTQGLLELWIARPDSAPGRKVSSPWPDRIRIDTVRPAGLRTCRVVGQVIYTTSVNETQGGDTLREQVVLRVTRDTTWRIDDYDVVQN